MSDVKPIDSGCGLLVSYWRCCCLEANDDEAPPRPSLSAVAPRRGHKAEGERRREKLQQSYPSVLLEKLRNRGSSWSDDRSKSIWFSEHYWMPYTMRFGRRATPSQPIVVAQMAEEEDDGTDENDKPPTSPSAEQPPNGANGVKIVLNENVLKPGSWLKGKILMEPGLPHMANVTITIQGTALVQFQSDDGKAYKSKNEFLSETIDLGGDIEQRIVLLTPNESNETALPFQHKLPADAPPSFVGTHGSISYECVAVVRFSSALTRRRIRRTSFQVQPRRSTSAGSAPPTPTTDEAQPVVQRTRQSSSVFHAHRMSSFGFSDGTVEVRLNVDETNLKRGRTPCKVVLEITNKTNLHLRDLRFGLMLSVEWNAKGRRITERKVIAEERKDDFCLRPKAEISLDAQFPPIALDSPPTVDLPVANSSGETSPSSSSSSCPLCRCSYVLFAKLVPPNFADTCLVEVPLNVY